MKTAGVLPFMLLAIAAITKSAGASRAARAVTDRKLVEGDTLALFIFKLFRRGLEMDAGHSPNQIANNGLLMIRGSLFRRVLQDSSFSMSSKYNYSDFHFFGIPIPNDYHVYLLVDDRYKKPEEMLRSIIFGRCKVGRSPDNATLPGVDGVLSATDKELEEWLEANELTPNSDNKLCNPEVKLAERVMTLGEWGPRAYSNYSLFEWSPMQTLARNQSSGHSYLYLRGLIQRAWKYSEFFGANLFKVKELHDVWLIATNWRLNFSTPRTADDEDKSFAGEEDESCKNGPQVEQDAEGHVQYVYKRSLTADALQLLELPNGEVLRAPRRRLCVKFCANAPMRFLKRLEGSVVEARCPTVGSAIAGAALLFDPNSLSPRDMHNERDVLSSVPGLLFRKASRFEQWVCRQLEPRYEPIAFSHLRRRQRNLYYRFQVFPLGAKRCCCF